MLRIGKTWTGCIQKIGEDPRNIRLRLSTYGFNPFGAASTSHSTWPVILIPYNFAPWLCMKPENFILSLLIPGSKSPGNNIDVYLELLVEVQELYVKGAKTYDASTDDYFTLRAALLGTICDYPGNAMASGRKTNKPACVVC